MGDIFGVTIPLVPQSFLDQIAAKILSFLDPILKPIRGAINLFFNFKEITVGTVDEARGVVDDAIGAYAAIKEFSINFDRDAKHRVVETVRAYQQIRRMAIDIPVEIWRKINELVSLGTTFSKRVSTQASEITSEIEQVEGAAELKTALSKLGPRVAKIVGKAFEILGALTTMLQAWHDALAELHTIVGDLREEIEKVNRLNFIFLPQNNKREKVKLENGETIYRRIPNSPIGS